MLIFDLPIEKYWDVCTSLIHDCSGSLPNVKNDKVKTIKMDRIDFEYIGPP
jgi:hypothetical protein